MISFFGSLRCSYRYTDAAFVVTYLYLHKTFAQMKIDAQKADAGEEMSCLLWSEDAWKDTSVWLIFVSKRPSRAQGR
eukprot:scaffold1700_cov181-Alexandrium_tamarense.AAC.23